MNRLALILCYFIIYPIVALGMLYHFFCILFVPKRAVLVTLAYDRLGNSLLGNDGRETVSSRLGRTGKPVWAYKLVNWIFRNLTGETDHCKNSIGY